MAIMSKLITLVAALSSLSSVNSQAFMTTNADLSSTIIDGETDLSSTIVGGDGSSAPNYFIDAFTFTSSTAYPLAYPVNKCVLISLVSEIYAQYTCMPLSTNDGYYVIKSIGTSSDCSSPSNTSRFDIAGKSAGSYNSFNCDGEDSFVTLDVGCSGTTAKLINVVTKVCYRNAAETLALLWTCGDVGNDHDYDNIQFASFTSLSCTGSPLATSSISFDECKTLLTDVNAKGVASQSMAGCDGLIDDGTTKGPDDAANYLTIIYVALISLIAVILV